MVKSYSVLIFVLVNLILALGCSPTFQPNQQVNEGNRPLLNEVNRVNSNRTEPGNLDDGDIKDMIRESSRKVKLTPLTKTTERDRFELRLWINLGMYGDERLLIVQENGQVSRAGFYYFGRAKDLPLGYHREILKEPRSGWTALRSEISNRLNNPSQLAPDSEFNIPHHEGLISMEFLENGKFRFVYYGHHSTFDDALRLKNLCIYLSDEFGLNIDCRGERTNLGPIR